MESPVIKCITIRRSPLEDAVDSLCAKITARMSSSPCMRDVAIVGASFFAMAMSSVNHGTRSAEVTTSMYWFWILE